MEERRKGCGFIQKYIATVVALLDPFRGMEA